jgi:adenosylhomocysteine nucleosidase
MNQTPRGPDRSCDVGILFALDVEADAFERRVADRVAWRGPGPVFSEGTLAGLRVAWCVSGVGGPAAARAAAIMLDGHRPRRLVSAGFAGGLDPAVPRGGVVRPGAVTTEQPGTRLPLAMVGAEATAAGPLVVSVDTVAATVAQKRALADRTGAAIVDMETHAIATVAAKARLPCLAVRVVSDDATQTLPAEVAALARPQSAFRRIGAVVGALGRRPTVALDLWRLYEHAVVDGRTLAAELERLCEEIAGGTGVIAGRPAVAPADRAADRPPTP